MGTPASKPRRYVMASRVECSPACTSGQSRAIPRSTTGSPAATSASSGSAVGDRPSSVRMATASSTGQFLPAATAVSDMRRRRGFSAIRRRMLCSDASIR
ncbi:hypothetical protein D3C72_1979610 [compost metagenome]